MNRISRRRPSLRQALRSRHEVSASGDPTGSHFDVVFYVPWIGPLLVSAAVGSPPGGAETQISLLSRALASQGVSVCLIAFEVAGVRLPSVIGKVVVSVRPPYRTRQRLGKIREAISLTRAIRRVRSTVVVARGATPDVGLVAIVARATGRRFVYSSANVSDFKFSGLSPKLRNRLLFRLSVRLADEVVVQTKEQIELCQQTFGRTPVHIRSIAESAPLRDRTPEAFLWIGRLVWYKRPLAFVELARSVPEAEFWMVGVPPMHDERERELGDRLVQEAAGVPNLTLLRPRPRAELMDLVERAVAIVNTADFEGMPNIFLEGWIRGVPALALTHDPDGVIEEFGLGAFAHGSRRQLAEAARAMWHERHHQAGVADRCRHYIDEFHSPERVSARWREVFGLYSRAKAP